MLEGAYKSKINIHITTRSLKEGICQRLCSFFKSFNLLIFQSKMDYPILQGLIS